MLEIAFSDCCWVRLVLVSLESAYFCRTATYSNRGVRGLFPYKAAALMGRGCATSIETGKFILSVELVHVLAKPGIHSSVGGPVILGGDGSFPPVVTTSLATYHAFLVWAADGERNGERQDGFFGGERWCRHSSRLPLERILGGFGNGDGAPFPALPTTRPAGSATWILCPTSMVTQARPSSPHCAGAWALCPSGKEEVGAVEQCDGTFQTCRELLPGGLQADFRARCYLNEDHHTDLLVLNFQVATTVLGTSRLLASARYLSTTPIASSSG